MSKRPAIPTQIKRTVMIESGHQCAVCGISGPLEIAHIIPYNKSKEHNAENLICLCANHHAQAEREKWRPKTYREYKSNPRVKQNNCNSNHLPKLTNRITLIIDMELTDFDETHERLITYGLAGFLDIKPEKVHIVSKEEGSVKVTIELPDGCEETILNAFEGKDSKLQESLGKLALKDIRREELRIKSEPKKLLLKNFEKSFLSFAMNDAKRKNGNGLRQSISSAEKDVRLLDIKQELLEIDSNQLRLSRPNTLKKQPLRERILSKKNVNIAVIGIGYVGLPIAVELGKSGFSVIGVDINKTIIGRLSAGRSTIEGISDKEIFDLIQKKQGLNLILADKEPSKIKPEVINELTGTDVFIICVQTPLKKDQCLEPDTKWIEKSSKLIQRVYEAEFKKQMLPKERLVLLESTTYPGTTRETFLSLLNKFNNVRTYLAYSPERTNPGPKAHEATELEPGTFNITKIVGGIDKESSQLAVAFYRTIFTKVHTVSSLEAAEMVKLVENTFRFIAINFANGISDCTKELGLNIWEIIEAVKTKEFGLDICFPGLIGGHCIPIDPHYLSWLARKHKKSIEIIDLAERNHKAFKNNALQLILQILNYKRKSSSSASILFFGVAFKKNVGDIRESSAIELMTTLYEYGAEISYWDPAINDAGPIRLRVKNVVSRSKPLVEGIDNLTQNAKVVNPRELRGRWNSIKNEIVSDKFDCIVIATDHDIFKTAYNDVVKSGIPVVDLKNALPTRLKSDKLANQDMKRAIDMMSKEDKYLLLGTGKWSRLE